MHNIMFVGKTNVGKSSLINTLIKRRFCVVGDLENLTNDVVKVNHNGVTMIDTPGLNRVEDLKFVMERADEADIVVIVIELGTDISLETKLLQYFKRKECILVVNKAEGKEGEWNNASLPRIETFFVSAISKLHVDQLRKRLGIPNKPRGDVSKNVKWSIFGRSNVGKSTLANALFGSERFKVRDERGTTRDIGQDIAKIGREHVNLVDTPGYIKNNSTSIQRAIQYRLKDHIEAGDFSVGIMVISAVDGITMLDRYMLNQIMPKFFVIICITKIDLVDEARVAEIRQQLHESYKNIDVVEVSGLKKRGITRLVKRIHAVIESTKDVDLSTPNLNKWLRNQRGVEHIKYMTHTEDYTFRLFAKRHVQGHLLRQLEKSLGDYLKLRGAKLNLYVVVN